MNIFDPSISGSLSVSGSGQVSGDLTVLGTLYATVSGTTQNAVSTSHAASYTLTSSFEQFTGSYTTGSFTGSFIGNGSGLYDIPASGVTGLNLSQISEGSATASIIQTDGLRVNTNVELTGSLKVSNIDLGVDKTVIINVTDSGGKYFIDNNRNPVLSFIKGFTYKFLFPNIGSHPFRFSTTNDGTHNGGTIYTTGVTTGSTPDYVQIEITSDTPSTLYYFCTSHTGMGNSISIYPDFLNVEADREVVYIEPSRIATTGSNTFIGTEKISGSLSVTGSVDITGSISLNGQPIGTGKLDETVFNSYTSSNDLRVSSIETSTGSLNSFTSSIDTTIKNKLDADGVVSGSLQISISGTSDYTTFSTSISQSISKSLADSKDYTDLQISLLDFATPLTALNQATSSLNSFSSSTLLRLNSIESESGSIRTDFNSYTSSNNSTNTTQNSRLNSLESTTSSINGNISSLYTSTASLNTFTSSTDGRLNSIESTTGSLNSYTSSNDSTNTTQNNRLTSIETSTSSLNSYTSSNNTNITAIHTATSSLNSFTSSIDTTIKNKLNNESVVSGSVQIDITNTTNYTTFSSSIATTDLNQNNRLNSLEGKTGSYATTGSNIFIGSQTITGSLYISQDLIVAGSSSIQNISSSILNIEDNIITVNALNPSVRFGGLAVIDSGSSPQVSGSMLFDSINNQWVFVHQNQSTITSSVLLMGPETYNNLGGEAYLTQNRIPKGTGIEHLNDSNITDTGTKVSINSNTEITGTLVVTGNISSPNISAIETSTSSLNSYTSALKAAIELTGSNLTVKGDLLVKGTTTNVNTTTLNVDNNLITLNGTGATSAGIRVRDTTAPNLVSGSLLWDATNDYWVAGQLGSEQRLVRETEFNNAVTRIGNVETSTGSLNSFTSSINTTIKSKLNSDGVVSGSSQISFNGITDKPTLVSGSSQISFNSISDKPTLVSGSSQITYGSISGIPSGIVSGSSQVSYTGLSNIPSGIVSGSSQITLSSTAGYAAYDATVVHLSGAETITGLKTFENSSTDQIIIKSTSAGTTDVGAVITMQGSDGSTNRTFAYISALKENSTSGNYASRLVFYTRANGAGLAEAVSIASNKNTTFGGTITATNFSGSSSGTNTGDQTNITGNAGTVTNGLYTTGDQTITGQKTFPSAIANRPILAGGFISAATGDLDVDIWGISEDYYPSHATAANAWGLQWYGTGNEFRFVGGGTNRVVMDMDNGNIVSTGTISGSTIYGTWNGASISTTYTDAKVTSISGTSNQVTASSSTGAITLSLPQNIHTAASPTFADLTLSGGITVGGSLSRGTYTTASNYVTGADNIVLKGNSSGVSGIFFESEKDGTNINHPSDFAFIQFHSYGIGGSSGEANRLVIGASNDADDLIVLNPMDTNGVKVRVGAGTTEYTVYHSGNIPTWNQNTTGNASNITAYTINQNLGTGNSPTFAGLALGDGIYTYSDTNRDAGAAAYYPNAWARGFRFSFANASSTNTAGNYSGVLHFHPWDGTTSSTGDASYQLAFGSTASNGGGMPQLRLRKGIDTTWNSWYTVPIKVTASFSSVASVTVTHNLNTKDVMVMCYDSGDEMFWPSSIVTTSVNVVTITFAASRTGRVVVIG